MDKNLFGEPYDIPQKKHSTEYDKKKRRWEYAFQRWSDKQAADGFTHYGACGYGAICDYCENNHYGRPCVRALNQMCREKRKKPDYETVTFENAFDGQI